MIRKKLYVVAMLSLSIITAAAASAASFAWFAGDQISMNDAKGHTASAYFAGGDGTVESPYIISHPIHLYNLAWLQYLGHFNELNNGALDQQYHFILQPANGESIDMKDFVLPPIGTTNNPFIGDFDGNDATIINLTVSNNIEDYPKKPVNVSSVTGVDIVGMFGVVGDIDGTFAEKYDTSANTIHDFYIDSAIVKTQTSKTLIGVAAGYVNGIISNVGVIKSGINVKDNIIANYDDNLTTNLSDYSIIGYCSKEYKTEVNKDTVTFSTVDTQTSTHTYKGKGDSVGWGGSVDMSEMYNRLVDIHNNYADTLTNYQLTTTNTTSTTGDVSIEATGTSSYYKHYTSYKSKSGKTYNNKVGSFVFSNYCSDNSGHSPDTTTTKYMYLHGGTYSNKIVYTDTGRTETKNITYYRLHNGTNYIGYSGTSLANVNSASDYGKWQLSSAPSNGATTTISTTINGQTYYLYHSADSASISLGMTSAIWTYESGSNGAFYLKYQYSSSNGWWSTTYNNYIRYNNGSWTISNGSSSSWNNTAKNNATQITFDSTQETTTIPIVETENFDYDMDYSSGNPYQGKNNTYFPLKANTTDYTPTSTNTGYVIAGGQFRSSTHSTEGSSSYLSKSGDIRVSQYSQSDAGSSISSKKLTTVYTINSSLNRATVSESDASFTKYKSSKALMETVLSESGTNLYGLHFMEATISMDHIVTADYASINNVEYQNYEFPADSIDFNLKEKGVVNFFAGTYFSGNNSFFSLHKIERDGNKITAIKEISKIYSDGKANHANIYKFADGTYSNYYEYGSRKEHINESSIISLPDGYAEAFDTTRIKKQSSVTTGALYYFEFPMNDGEFALGSVDGGTGCYLVYLDISANATQVDRTTFIQTVTKITNAFSYPNGIVTSTDSSATVTDGDTATLIIEKGFSGQIVLTRTNDIISLSTSSQYADTSNYVSEGRTLTDSGGNSIDPLGTEITSTIKQMTIVDYNESTASATITTITDTTKSVNGGDPKTERTVTITDADGNDLSSEDSSIYDDNGDEIGSIEDSSGVTFSTANCTGTLFELSYYYPQDGTFEVTLKVTATKGSDIGENFYTFTGNTAILTAGAEGNTTVHITKVALGYALTINGTELTATGSYSIANQVAS